MSLRVEVRNYWRDLLFNRIFASALLPKPLRWRVLRAAGMPVSKSSIPPGTFFGSPRVEIGPGTHISYGCFFDALDWITIGRNVDVAMHVTFATSTHHIGTPERRAGESRKAPIVVGDGVWIGARSIILPGVSIGEGVVIAAGSVVTSDCDANSVYAGVPAKRKSAVDETPMDQTLPPASNHMALVK